MYIQYVHQKHKHNYADIFTNGWFLFATSTPPICHIVTPLWPSRLPSRFPTSQPYPTTVKPKGNVGFALVHMGGCPVGFPRKTSSRCWPRVFYYLWVVPPPRNSGKWRLIEIREPKHVILIVTITGKECNPQYTNVYKCLTIYTSSNHGFCCSFHCCKFASFTFSPRKVSTLIPPHKLDLHPPQKLTCPLQTKIVWTNQYFLGDSLNQPQFFPGTLVSFPSAGVPSWERENISHQTGKPENHRLKSAGWEGIC